MKRWMLVGLVALGSLACDRPGGAPTTSEAVRPRAAAASEPPDTLVVVDGAPITELDVRFRLKNDSHEAKKSDDRLKVVLETMVRQEVLAQRALELGLDRDPKYMEGLRNLEVAVDAYRRKELSELLLNREVDRRAQPTEAEARSYFEKNQARLRSELHVLQILKRNEGQIEEANNQISAGKAFEEVAALGLPGAPGQDRKPWDLGFMKWYQVPEAWRAALGSMKPGDVSPVIKGPNERFWLIKLVETHEDAAMTFESVKGEVLSDIRRARVEELRESVVGDLMQKARIEYRAPTAHASAPVEE